MKKLEAEAKQDIESSKRRFQLKLIRRLKRGN